MRKPELLSEEVLEVLEANRVCRFANIDFRLIKSRPKLQPATPFEITGVITAVYRSSKMFITCQALVFSGRNIVQWAARGYGLVGMGKPPSVYMYNVEYRERNVCRVFQLSLGERFFASS